MARGKGQVQEALANGKRQESTGNKKDSRGNRQNKRDIRQANNMSYRAMPVMVCVTLVVCMFVVPS